MNFDPQICIIQGIFRVTGILNMDFSVDFIVFIQEYSSVAQNYLFSAPPLFIISTSAPAPAPATFCHLKLYYNSTRIVGTIRNTGTSQWRFFPYPSVLKTDCSKFKKKNIISASARGLK